MRYGRIEKVGPGLSCPVVSYEKGRFILMRMQTQYTKKGFTLIELLVVIAIIAILAVVVILTINPAQLLKQARDSNRISDLATLKSALSLYLADYPQAVLASSYTTCYMYAPGTSTAQCGGMFTTAYATNATSTSRAVNGSGWIAGPNFNNMSSGVPFGQLPIDPVNNASYYYAYAATSSNMTFKIAAFMESTKYSASGTSDVVSTDGGINNNAYEVGSNVGL